MPAPLDEQYFEWLYKQVSSVRLRNPSRTYWRLLRQLYTKEFVWHVANDDNRVEDGRDLRVEFARQSRVRIDSDWLDLGCSMLEMMLGLSRRLAFEAGGESRDWFWQLIENLGLTTFNDMNYNESYEREVDRVLEDIIWRRYRPDGSGGLFPLRYPDRDQRKVELWYQLNAYILERD